MDDIDLGALRSLKLRAVRQLGFVVKSIHRSLPRYASLYNLQTWFQPRFSAAEYQIGARTIGLDVQVIAAWSGKSQIELIEANGDEASPYHTHIAERGEGLHHLGVYVRNLDERMKTMKRLGIEVLIEGRLTTAGRGSVRFAYFDTEQLCGTILELIEVKAFGINIPQNRFIMNVGSITGDVTRTRV